jgi:hypothetical protein
MAAMTSADPAAAKKAKPAMKIDTPTLAIVTSIEAGEFVPYLELTLYERGCAMLEAGSDHNTVFTSTPIEIWHRRTLSWC